MQIYKITNLINSKIYIGKDTTDNELYYGSGKLIKRSIKKYGIENFKKEIIEECSDYQLLSEREIYWIEYYNSNNLKIGYNISKGGDGGDTISNNISKVRKGKTYEEMFGDENAKKYKNKLSVLQKELKSKIKGKKIEEIYGDRSIEIKNKISKSPSRKLKEKKRIPIKLSDESLHNIKLKLGNKIEIDGITYISVSEASKLLEIDRGTIRYRLKSNKYKNYIYI